MLLLLLCDKETNDNNQAKYNEALGCWTLASGAGTARYRCCPLRLRVAGRRGSSCGQ